MTTALAATAEDLERKNREVYDDVTGPVWRLAVYDALHEGWELIDLGGLHVLDEIARRADLGPGLAALELGSGQGAGCRYLAERWGCEVTGVERNPRQMDRARALLDKLARRDPGAASRVRLIEEDAIQWRPDRLYDVVYSVDAFMLIADLAMLLRKACEALQPGGRLLASAILAGPNLDEPLRRFVWEVDGMINLPSAAEYREILAASGLRDAVVEDLTPLAIESSERMAAALERHARKIVASHGQDVYCGWTSVGEIYLSAFRERKLTYQFLDARRAPA